MCSCKTVCLDYSMWLSCGRKVGKVCPANGVGDCSYLWLWWNYSYGFRLKTIKVTVKMVKDCVGGGGACIVEILSGDVGNVKRDWYAVLG